MTTKRMLQSILIICVLAGGLALPVTAARAMSGACGGYITVEASDTLQSIATTCGTTLDAIRTANPGVGAQPAPGQVLFVPGTTPVASVTASTPQPGGTYVVQVGDTLGDIAFMRGITLSRLLAVNPQISNPSLIFPGQVINLPAGATSTATPVVTPIPTSTGFGFLQVINGRGLRVRTGPGMNFPEILSPFVSAVKFTNWQYRKSSVTIDPTGFVWVQVTLNPLSGYSTGWILTRDSLGTYFTRPNIGPKITPNDP